MAFGGMGTRPQMGSMGAVGGGSSVSRPAAPALTWTSADSDTTPDFDVDLPSGYSDAARNAQAGDHLILEYQLQAGGAWTQYLDHPLSSGDISDDDITVSDVDAVPSGDYYFRARLQRGGLIGDNSSNEEVTIAGPVISEDPVISGNVQVGQTLSTTNGVWSFTPSGYTYQWKRDGSSIGGATANTHVLVELDAGADITCEVTAYDGGVPAAPATSNSLTIDVYVLYLSQILDTTDATTYSGGSWNTVSLGTAAANRKIVIGFATRNTTGTSSISSGSVGAASGSEIVAEEQNTVGGIWMWEYANSTDATANISTTFAGAGQIRLGARLYAVYGAGAATGHHNYNAATTSIANNSVVVPTNGASISSYYAINIGNPGTVTWTNATADGSESVIEGTVGTIDSARTITSGTVNISAAAGISSNMFVATAAYGPS
jgi:hypothetical protein